MKTNWILINGFVAACFFAGVFTAAAEENSGKSDETNWRAPLHVELDRNGSMFLDEVSVDTLLVHRGQKIYWHKRDPAGAELTVQFERKLFHERYRIRLKLTDSGKTRFLRVNGHARMRPYFGNPEKGFNMEKTEGKSLWIRVVPPPD